MRPLRRHGLDPVVVAEAILRGEQPALRFGERDGAKLIEGLDLDWGSYGRATGGADGF